MNQNSTLSLKHCSIKEYTEIDLPASKSVANRALIVNALAGGKTKLINLSTANDTQLMQALLKSDSPELNAEDAGTTMRFLTAFTAVSSSEKVLTGTERMKKRPLKILVNALRELGAQVDYLENDGYPPIKINPFQGQKTDQLTVKANISSQYISALMMLAPVLEKGLTLELEGKVGSRPYIEMTQKVMEAFGAKVHFEGNTIHVEPGGYSAPKSYTIEPDWSAASYWYSVISVAQGGKIVLRGLAPESIQGDSAIQHIARHLGVSTEFTEQGALLAYSNHLSQGFDYDFKDCPDLAQTIVVCCAANGISGSFTGLESLRIKETDRIVALQNELGKFSAGLRSSDEVHWETFGHIHEWEGSVAIETYEDHRMAMSFAPLIKKGDLTFQTPDVVKKSYPHFWKDLLKTFPRIQVGQAGK